MENVKKCTNQDLEKIIEESYTPENSTLVIVGGIDYDKTLELVESSFARWEDKDTRQYKETVESEPGIYFNASNNGKNAVVSIGFRTPSYLNKDRVNIEILSKILGDTSLESRLVQEIRMKKGLAYTIGSFANFYQNRGTLGFSAVCEHKAVKEVIKIMMNEFNKVKDYGFNDSEIMRAKKVLETRKLLELDSLVSQLKFLGKCSSNGQLFSLEQEIRTIKKVRNESLNRTIKDIFIEDNMGLAAIGNLDIDEIIPMLKIG